MSGTPPEYSRKYRKEAPSRPNDIKADNDNYSSHSVTIKTHHGTGLPFCCVSLSYLLSLTLWASPFGGAESLAPPGAKDVAEPKGLAGAPG